MVHIFYFLFFYELNYKILCWSHFQFFFFFKLKVMMDTIYLPKSLLSSFVTPPCRMKINTNYYFFAFVSFISIIIHLHFQIDKLVGLRKRLVRTMTIGHVRKDRQRFFFSFLYVSVGTKISKSGKSSLIKIITKFGIIHKWHHF